VFLLKYSARPAEVEEGVAFYGRAGGALMKSLKRLGIDPLAVYGTLCVKCPVSDPALADPACLARLIEELAIVDPKLAVVMAYAAALAYFALAGSLPDLGDSDATAIVSGAVGMLALAACTFTLLPARDELPALVALAAGGLLLGGALTAAGSDAGADVAKVLFA